MLIWFSISSRHAGKWQTFLVHLNWIQKCLQDFWALSHLPSYVFYGTALEASYSRMYGPIFSVYRRVDFEIRPMMYFYWRSGMSLQRTSDIIVKILRYFCVFIWLAVVHTVVYMTHFYCSVLLAIEKNTAPYVAWYHYQCQVRRETYNDLHSPPKQT